MKEYMDQTVSSSDSKSLETETKYVLPAHHAVLVIGIIKRTCDPDPKYPFGIISSIYYDSANWDYLREKRDSDYLKTKVRLRWYEQTEPATESPDISHAEVKYRIGSKRMKIRVPTEFSGRYLATIALIDSELARIPLALAAKGAPIRQPIFPAFLVRYRRHRFVDRSTGARLCFDDRISAPKSNPRMVARSYPCFLRKAVLEVKGTDGEVPLGLRNLLTLGLRRESFSKYYECYAELTRTFF